MTVSLLSRYRNQTTVEITSSGRGKTHSLPIRRFPIVENTLESRNHQFTSYETVDLLALKYFGREELYWALLDANGSQYPGQWEIGEEILIPSISRVTQVQIPGR